MTDQPQPISPELLHKACNPDEFSFETTDELADIGIIIGQERALQAIHFGVGIQQKGFNVFALGPPGIGKQTAVQEAVTRQAESQSAASDWCYLNNFSQPSRPRALPLPAGQGKIFVRDVEQLIEDVSNAIPAAFQAEEYRVRAEEIEEESKEREAKALNELRLEAQKQRITLIETPAGFAFAPVDDKNHEVLNTEGFKQLPETERQAIQENIARLHQQLQKILRQFPAWRKETREKLKALHRDIAQYSVNFLIGDLKATYAQIAGVVSYLDELQQDIIDRVDDFLPKSEAAPPGLLGQSPPANPLQRYKVNLLVDHGGEQTAPIIYEGLPTHGNLLGRVEYQAHMGTLVTDFTMIKAGSLHRANGGYLILDAREVLLQPFAWDSLKRTLQAGMIRIESLERALSLISTVSLEPEPIPLRVKIILTGDRLLYYLLNQYDPDFRSLFKVAADFEESFDRADDGHQVYARVIGSLARRNKLRPLERQAVSRVIEHSARLVGDSAKLTTHLRSLADLLKEADYWAGQAARTVISRDDVQAAIDHQIYRADRVRERIYETIRRGTVFIATDGEKVGQINGLSVLTLGDFSFGQPSRITATTRLGDGKIIDIERETQLGGALHSKGVLILSSFIAARYARANPFSVVASLVFEQSYGMVEGDSASLAELCAILSSLAETPIRQSFAVTGSVDQHGRVQPIGGVNEKIEGFFDICKAKGLSGTQGVLIPAANAIHLMLRRDVRDAASAGQFHVYSVQSVDEALTLLTGVSAGVPDASGHFPAESVNGRVEKRLGEFTAIRQKLARKHHEEDKNGESHE
jgi:lon-related putative ATP-dependent protease